ncbi:cation:proton antiporter [Martelella mediterranea]|uniref:Multicomponent Na+:H+ antiporter subunit F n=1 Tax=Martelella mediterranea TaxID=293089 RepID=A0A4R3NKK7_9HYPH|nr:cation:proton antiporter [Martelella mediterranea]TCT35494.1 multicomponent Na+:H+ antiporter subunit F [Martelella mediterranea]
MTPETIVQWSAQASIVILCLSLILTGVRVVKGPTLPDRALALDMLVAVGMAFIVVIAIRTGFTLYIDIAIALGLVGFLATVAFARFIRSSGMRAETRTGFEVKPHPMAYDHGESGEDVPVVTADAEKKG